jgi:hypothetical protein
MDQGLPLIKAPLTFDHLKPPLYEFQLPGLQTLAFPFVYILTEIDGNFNQKNQKKISPENKSSPVKQKEL